MATATSTKTSINLQSISCQETSERGKDEVYIKYSVDGGHPKRFPSKGYHSMSPTENNPWTINLPITYKETLVISLYDSDLGGDDFLGSYTYNTSDANQNESNPVSNTNGARYTINTTPGS